jgi:hypothetical protein
MAKRAFFQVLFWLVTMNNQTIREAMMVHRFTTVVLRSILNREGTLSALRHKAGENNNTQTVSAMPLVGYQVS